MLQGSDVGSMKSSSGFRSGKEEEAGSCSWSPLASRGGLLSEPWKEEVLTRGKRMWDSASMKTSSSGLSCSKYFFLWSLYTKSIHNATYNSFHGHLDALDVFLALLMKSEQCEDIRVHQGREHDKHVIQQQRSVTQLVRLEQPQSDPALWDYCYMLQ